MGQPEFLALPQRLDAPLCLDPAAWSPGDVHRLHSALITPRPVAWMSTRSAGAGPLPERTLLPDPAGGRESEPRRPR